MNVFLKVAVFSTIVSLFGCAPQVALLKETASGQPEGVFDSTTVEDVKGKLASICSRNGLLVVNTNNHEVVCQKNLTGRDAALASISVSLKHGTGSTPTRKLRFVMFKSGNGVQVVAYDYLESKNAFGQANQVPMNNNKHRNDIQQMLFSLGAR